MTRIRYIGLKAVKTDNVAHTDIVWTGGGDVQDVPEAAAAKLLAYSAVWEEAAGDPGAGKPSTSDAASAVAALDALRAEATALGVRVNGTWREARLLKEITDAKAAQAAGDPGAGDTPQA